MKLADAQACRPRPANPEAKPVACPPFGELAERVNQAADGPVLDGLTLAALAYVVGTDLGLLATVGVVVAISCCAESSAQHHQTCGISGVFRLRKKVAACACKRDQNCVRYTLARVSALLGESFRRAYGAIGWGFESLGA
jgi:hypothetical protein